MPAKEGTQMLTLRQKLFVAWLAVVLSVAGQWYWVKFYHPEWVCYDCIKHVGGP